jgi:hypothetical protein
MMGRVDTAVVHIERDITDKVEKRSQSEAAAR